MICQDAINYIHIQRCFTQKIIDIRGTQNGENLNRDLDRGLLGFVRPASRSKDLWISILRRAFLRVM